MIPFLCDHSLPFVTQKGNKKWVFSIKILPTPNPNIFQFFFFLKEKKPLSNLKLIPPLFFFLNVQTNNNKNCLLCLRHDPNRIFYTLTQCVSCILYSNKKHFIQNNDFLVSIINFTSLCCAALKRHIVNHL